MWLKVAENLDEPGERAKLAATARNFRYAMDHGLLDFDAGDLSGENAEEKIARAAPGALPGQGVPVLLLYPTWNIIAFHRRHTSPIIAFGKVLFFYPPLTRTVNASVCIECLYCLKRVLC